MRFNAKVAVFVLSFCPAIASAGDLNPPPGPVSPTMKSLDAIEPRVCLNDLPGDEGAAVLITEPGSYFLRADVQGFANAHGIRIVTSGDVRIDLNGFAVRGGPGSLDGVNMQLLPGGPPSSLELRCDDGSGRATISGWGGSGVRVENVRRCDISRIISADNGGHGIHVNQGEVISLRSVTTQHCGGDGVRVRGTGQPAGRRQYSVVRCVSSSNIGCGFYFELPADSFEVDFADTSSSDNRGVGFSVEVTSDSSTIVVGARSPGVCQFDRCVALANTADGVRVVMPENNGTAISATELSSIGNDGNGLIVAPDMLAAIHRGHVTVLKLSEFSGNGGNGISSRNPLFVTDATFKGNALSGVTTDGPDAITLMGTIIDSVFMSNGSFSARGDSGRYRISRCQISEGGDVGVVVDDGCLIMDNTSVTNCVGGGIDVNGTLNVRNSSFRRNAGPGVRVSNGECVATDIVCELNTLGGSGAVFIDCTSVTLRRCVFNDNEGDGVRSSSTVGPTRWMSPESIASNNGGSGFDLDDCFSAHLDRCVSSGNGGAGFLLGGKFDRGRIERCVSSDNAGGEFFVMGSGTLVIGSRATTNPAGSFTIAPGNVRGPIIDELTIDQNCNPDANIIY